MALAAVLSASSYFAILCGFIDMVFAPKPPSCKNITNGEIFICHASAAIENPYTLMSVRNDQINGHIMGIPHKPNGWPDIYAGSLGINCTLFNCDCGQISLQTCVQSNCIEPSPEDPYYNCNCTSGTEGTFCEITNSQSISYTQTPSISRTSRPSISYTPTPTPTLAQSLTPTLTLTPTPTRTRSPTALLPDEPPVVLIILPVVCIVVCLFALVAAYCLYKKYCQAQTIDDIIAMEQYLETSMHGARPLYYNKDGAVNV